MNFYHFYPQVRLSIYLGDAAAAPPAEGEEGEGEAEFDGPTWCNPEDPMGAWLLYKVSISPSIYISNYLNNKAIAKPYRYLLLSTVFH